MRMMRTAAMGVAALAVTATALTAAQVATADDFDVTANGLANGQVVADLPPSSKVELAISHLPAGVGLYAFHCLVPSPGASPVPTRCDSGTETVLFIRPAQAAQSVTQEIRVNAEFTGSNPNPQSGDTGTTEVDCRSDSCAIYTLGSGADSANRAYVRFFPTTFAEVGPRKKDRATVTLNNRVVKPGRERTVSYSTATPIVVTLKSGIEAVLASRKCDVRNGEIRALAKKGSCTVKITSPGNDQYRPFTGTVTFKIKK